MKANSRSRRAVAALYDKAVIGAALAALAGCVAPREPVPPVVVRPVTRPAASRPAPPAAADWRDRAQTPGDWTWRAPAGGYRQAGFGNVLSVACLQPGQVHLTVYDHAGPFTIRTTSLARAITPSAPDTATTAGRIAVSADFPAGEPLLDAMAFSRGRFAIEFASAPPLAIPSWPELGRVIDDCR